MMHLARVTPIWKKQKLFFGIFLLCFGGYFLLDGAYVWPRSNERYLKHHEFAERGDEAGWIAYAQERGWNTKPPEKLHTDLDIYGQFFFFGLCLLGSVWTLTFWARNRGRTLSMDDEAIYSPEGVRVPFTAITGLGLKLWESKGLARVRYSLDGRTREFIVDDYKYDTEPCRAMVEELKKRLAERAAATAPASQNPV